MADKVRATVGSDDVLGGVILVYLSWLLLTSWVA